MREVLNEHLTLFAEGAGDQTDSRVLRDVLGHRHPVVDRLVIGMRMDQHEPPGGFRGHIRAHGPTLCGERRVLRWATSAPSGSNDDPRCSEVTRRKVRRLAVGTLDEQW